MNLRAPYKTGEFSKPSDNQFLKKDLTLNLINYLVRLCDIFFAEVKIHIAIFWVMLACSLVGGYKCFGGA
jgi:hypothetical protein